MRSRTPWLARLTLLLTVLPLQAGEVLTLDPAATRIYFLLGATGHDVKGSFALKGGEVAFDPIAGTASGDITIDLTVAKTGNGSRDKTMHQDVLETATYPTAVFHARRLGGTLAPSGSSTVTLEGVLTFHGADHPLSLAATVTRLGDRLRAETAFDIPFVEWGLDDPSIFILRVEKSVHVTVSAEGSVRAAGN